MKYKLFSSRKRKVTQEILIFICENYPKMTIESLSKKLGVGESTIHAHLVYNGISPKKVRNKIFRDKLELNKDEIVRKYNTGNYYISQLGDEYGVNITSMSKFLREHTKMKCKRKPRPKDGRYLTKDGYINVIPNEEDCKYKTYNHSTMLEHRLVMAKFLGRSLLKSETVHHKNGIRTDNRIENLELRAGNHGPGQTVQDLVFWAREIIRVYDKIPKLGFAGIMKVQKETGKPRQQVIEEHQEKVLKLLGIKK